MAQHANALSGERVSIGLAAAGNGFSRSHVGEIQRARMLVAMAEVASERGAGNVSVMHVVERAGVSRRTFYEIFKDCEDCFLGAIGEAIDLATRHVTDVYHPDARWVERVRSALEALLRFLEEEPALGRLLIVESLSGGANALELRGRVVNRIVSVIDEAGKSNTSSAVTVLTAEGIVGGVVSVIQGHMIKGDPRPLAELANPLMSMIVLPYLGANAAREELERPNGEASSSARPVAANPLKGLEMRLTYRTVCVLAAITTNRGASNRAIGDAAGVSDQGQISKLLTRLEKLGLIRNDGDGSSRGARNAWTLTKQGEEVADVIATRTARS